MKIHPQLEDSTDKLTRILYITRACGVLLDQAILSNWFWSRTSSTIINNPYG